MKFRIPQQWLVNFVGKFLREAGIDDEKMEDDLESLIYEAEGRQWDEYEDENGDIFYYIDFDF